jgi:2-oxoglutarate dehydrogenase complex dehydrogenase (E1) component-like enzyme
MDSESAVPYEMPPTLGESGSLTVSSLLEQLKSGTTTISGGQPTKDLEKAYRDSFKIMQLIRSFMTHGHLSADLDPLKLASTGEEAYTHKTHKNFGRLIDYK